MFENGNPFLEEAQEKAPNTIGERIRVARKLQSMSQDDLAKAFPEGREKKRAVIGRYENETINPPLDVIKDLAAILRVDPAYLAFGDGPERVAHALRSDFIPVYQSPHDDAAPEHVMLPFRMLEEFKAENRSILIVRLEVEAPLFGIRVDDYALVDTGVGMVSDGRLYVVNTSAGPALFRSEPLFTPNKTEALKITSGQGVTYTPATGELEVLGCVIASIQKRL